MFHLFDHVVLRFCWDVLLPRHVCLSEYELFARAQVECRRCLPFFCWCLSRSLFCFFSVSALKDHSSLSQTVHFLPSTSHRCASKSDRIQSAVLCNAMCAKLDHLLERHKLVVVFCCCCCCCSSDVLVGAQTWKIITFCLPGHQVCLSRLAIIRNWRDYRHGRLKRSAGREKGD